MREILSIEARQSTGGESEPGSGASTPTTPTGAVAAAAVAPAPPAGPVAPAPAPGPAAAIVGAPGGAPVRAPNVTVTAGGLLEADAHIRVLTPSEIMRTLPRLAHHPPTTPRAPAPPATPQPSPAPAPAPEPTPPSHTVPRFKTQLAYTLSHLHTHLHETGSIFCSARFCLHLQITAF